MIINSYRFAGGSGLAAYLAAQDADSPTARWLLDETSGTNAADDIGSNDLTHTASPTLAATDPFGGSSAVTYNGSTQYSSRTSSVLGSTPSVFSIEMMVKGAAQDNKYIFGLGRSSSGNPFIGVSSGQTGLGQATSDVKLAWRRDDAVSIMGAGDVANDAFDNAWKHIVVTLASGVAKYYINGVLEFTSSSLSVGTTTLDRTAIGALLRTSAGNYFTGSISTTAVYTTALSATRITAHYDASGI